MHDDYDHRDHTPLIRTHGAHGQRCQHNRHNINRIRRIKGQLEALERLLEADEGTCEERVIRARTIEKAVASLTNHLVTCYMENTARYEMADNPDKVIADMSRLIELLHK
ncbi:MAG: metal-sensitive transcriptional regulator [Anaerolineae bacterium]|nr:metal-sensitive transcriptional regulator [Anaerolineae bacterium]MDW8173704.1 metal-sensing transcriptional repressor [Anaerolineae bacterium]